MKLSTAILSTGILALTTLILSSCNSDSQQSQVVSGPFSVYYDIQVSPTETAGTGANGEEVSEICFHNNY